MNQPGPFQFQLNGGAFSPLGAGVLVGDVMLGFSGIDALSLQAQFQYGSSGGTSVTAYIQTSIDQGQTWFDIACFQFTTASGIELANISALDAVTAVRAPISQGLNPNTALDGVLGDRFRAIVVVVGTYLGVPILNLTGVAR